jgi:AraC-like DNA-binding protein
MGEPPILVRAGVSVHRAGKSVYSKWPTDCLHLHRYAATLTTNGKQMEFPFGTATVNSRHSTFSHEWNEDLNEHIYIHFQTKPTSGDPRHFPSMKPLGEAFESFYTHGLEVVNTARNLPNRAVARLWDLLWQLSEPETDNGRVVHPALERAIGIIERELGTPLSASEIAERCHLSHSQLLRLFRSSFNMSVVRYIRMCRIERAKDLLLHTTLPVKEVAHNVGISDAQFFNKTIRVELGESPTQLRKGQT